MLAKNLQAAAGNAAEEAPDITELFSTWLYTGNGATQTITNGIDLAGKGGLVWLKRRNYVGGNVFYDTVRGATKLISSNQTNAESTNVDGLTAFNSNGFSLGSSYPNQNVNGDDTYVSWTFREQAKFFDVVTYTGNGVAGRSIPHNLGSVPGCIIVKNLALGTNWTVYHRGSDSSAPQDYEFYLDGTNARIFSSAWNNTAPTSTHFTVGSGNEVNRASSLNTYVAYLFAHNAGGFGLSGEDNVISCGSFNYNTFPQTVELGYEPQWLMVKKTDGAGDWIMFDNMRGFTANSGGGAGKRLLANTSGAETNNDGLYYGSATGFNLNLPAFGNYIYIAIRRGPMKVPTDGTSVYNADAEANATAPWFTSGFPVDFAFKKVKTAATDWQAVSRLTGTGYLRTNGTFAEETSSEIVFDFMNGWNSTTGANSALWSAMFRRAPGFFDVVCYTGTGVDLTVNHNLGVVPEWVIIKNRSRAGTNWSGAYFANASEYYDVRLNQDIGRPLTTMGPLGPTLISNSATTFGVLGGSTLVNSSGDTYVAYLFATCPGVSKVGSYTGTAATLQINCGFTTGARFVLIKRTDSTGDWYVWDSARGIVAGNDPYLLLNSTAAEVTSTDYVDTYSAGFEITSTAPAAINASGGSFIFFAVA